MLSTNWQKIDAWVDCGGTWHSDSPGNWGSGAGGEPECSATPKVYCDLIEDDTKESVTLKEDIYDANNNFIGEWLLIKDKYRFVAGRFVGIDAYEEYEKTYSLTIVPHCTVQYERTDCSTQCCDPAECGGLSCTTVCTTLTWCGSCEATVADCRDEADEKLESLARGTNLQESFIATRQDVNDINKGHINGKPTIEVAPSQRDVDYGKNEPEDRNSAKVWRTVKMAYTYNLPPAWINPQTGEVKYENDTDDRLTLEDDDKKTFIKVPELSTARYGNPVRIGTYFIPLNAKSTDLVRYNLTPDYNRPALSKELCYTIIDKYNVKSDTEWYWKDFLVSANYEELISKRASTAAAAKSIVRQEGGCRMALYAYFRIAQGFYHEVGPTKPPGTPGAGEDITIGPGDTGSSSSSSQISIKGFNFYYRPIEFSASFPNGLSYYSYWINVYNKERNAVTVKNASDHMLDLDDSFRAVTYFTDDNYNLDAIRAYNAKDDNKYTSMAKINKSGTSSFISGGYGVSRKYCQTYYALGCGPEDPENSLYAGYYEECKKRKTGVCKE